jgi:hypothetical protein
MVERATQIIKFSALDDTEVRDESAEVQKIIANRRVLMRHPS